jgi:probable HAF family extracellular repeat protein
MNRSRICILIIALLSLGIAGCWPDGDAGWLWDLLVQTAEHPDDADTAADGKSLVAKASRLDHPRFAHPKFQKLLGGDLPTEAFELGAPLAEFFEPGSKPLDGGEPQDVFPPDADGEVDCEATYYETDGHAGQGFEACVTVEGRIGSVTGRKNHTFELSVHPWASPSGTHEDFDWENGVAHAFSFVWDGLTATFEVDGVVLQREVECESANAFHLRARANKGVLEVSDLAVDDRDLTCDLQAHREHGNDLHIMRVVGDFADGVAVTGTVRMVWDEQHPPRNAQLSFAVKLGVVEGEDPEPPADCNGNGVPDDEDLLSGTSSDCNADGVPDECQCDADGDGMIDACDGCPQDPNKVFPGACGCGVDDMDADEDGIADCDDLCPETELGAAVDEYGCEIPSLSIAEDITLRQVMPVQLWAEFSGGTPPYTFWWSAPGWDGSAEQNPLVMPTTTTTYTVTACDSSDPPNVLTDALTVTIETPVELSYTLVSLGSLSSNGSYPSGINDLGQVVGYYRDDAGAMRAFLYSDGAMIDLGTLGGGEAYARDINNLGQVVGEATNAEGHWRAFLWDSVDGMRDLGTLGGVTSSAYAINEFGQIAGYADDGAALHAFLYSAGVMASLGTLDFYQSGVFDINDYGQMSGVVVPFTGEPHAVVLDGGAVVDLGSAIAGGSQGWNINNLGMVTGYAWGSGAYRSFLYGADRIVDLGTLAGFRDTYVYGLNDAGQIVGAATNTMTSVSHAFLYSGGVMIDLNDLVAPESGWEYLTAAFAINNAGQITGYGLINGQFVGFLLTPPP